MGGGRGAWFRPVHLACGSLVLGALALAGPTWEREVTPFTQDAAPLVIAIDVSRSMNAIDVEPTRLERAKQKARDLLRGRGGARTALVAYAGTAHMVLPPTDDTDILETYLMALETDLMPVEGDDPAAALAVAERMLAREETPGSILFLTDGVPQEQIAAFSAHTSAGLDPLLVLGVGTSEGGPVKIGDGRFETGPGGARAIAKLDKAGLERLAREADAFVATITLDDRDVRQVQRRVEAHLVAAREEDETARWRDFGYDLVFPIAMLHALWFRRGWTVRWT